MKVNFLRKQYPEFIYQDYIYKYVKPNLEIWFDFLIKPDFKFKTKIVIKKIPLKRFKGLSKKDLNNLVFNLGLIEMLNYWKLTCSPLINIEAGNLNRKQIFFLRKIISSGMRQYFYENNISFTEKNFLTIKVNKDKEIFKKFKLKLNSKRILIPIGGGKDSIISIELLRRKGIELGSFVLNPCKSQKDVIKISGLKENIFIERKLDKKLFELNKNGYLNGHVPFSAFLSFLSILTATLFDYGRIAFAWERASDEPNLKYKGKWVNHQWSKSSEFEKLLKEYVGENINIFSPVRKFSEIELAEMFSKLKRYHSSFMSCNVGCLKDKWCCQCPKCLSLFITLYPFLENREMVKIFGKNLFNDKKLNPLMLSLLGKKRIKPFECVGTKKDILLGLKLSLKKAKEKGKIPYLLKSF